MKVFTHAVAARLGMHDPQGGDYDPSRLEPHRTPVEPENPVSGVYLSLKDSCTLAVVKCGSA